MNKFLKTKSEVDHTTAYLIKNNLKQHDFECKNWDIALICQELTDGDHLDMGSNGSHILQNAVLKGTKGLKCGIDLGDPEYKIEGVEYVKGDLMNTGYENQSFDIITCLSVIEHEVDYEKLATECSRLLRPNGRIFITFDYWNPKVDTTDVGTKLYGLKWNILDRNDVEMLLIAFAVKGFKIPDMDWSTQDAVINPQFCAPYEKSYTFGIIELTK